jgi:hypothetical protein
VGHAGSHDFQTSGLKAGVDLTDHVLGNCVWLNDGKGAFDGHGEVLVFFKNLFD